MTTQVLPVHSNTPHYRFNTQLKGTTFGFQFDYNTRDAAWYFSIFSDVGMPILTGQRLTLGAMYLLRNASPVRPKGWIYALDSTRSHVDPGRNDLGTRVKLYFSDFA